ncbi:PREDICTED: secreted frizzled-related protein 5-like isoform X2 [Priapulus caudatus]|uniref:Secreted frizzled-related protein 5-like isoform X2 n=1 Tax=Priapulus caudatus TaxID=37621 RepID=A0ABM1E413_PRICU|nr:PREDICTED: secreted frizzled-related protein 5-like isoform X2 [Priapulus caudatus]
MTMLCRWWLLGFLAVIVAATAVDSDYIVDWALSGARSQPTCVDIPSNVTLCQGIGYSKMRLPNLLEHDTMLEVTQQARAWVPLLSIACHADAQLFLCSLYAPVCLDRPIYPCRSLCEAVRSGCEARMSTYGYPWPEMFQCDKFPIDNDMCIAKQTRSGGEEVKGNQCDACNQVVTYENILDNYCRAGFAAKVKIRKMARRKGAVKVVMRKKMRKFKRGALTRRDLKRLTVYMQGASGCECPMVANLTAAKRTSYLLMGRKVNDTIVGSLLLPWSKEASDFKRAVRKFKNLDCSKETKFVVEKTIRPGKQNGGGHRAHVDRPAEAGSETADGPGDRPGRQRHRGTDKLKAQDKAQQRKDRKKSERKNRKRNKANRAKKNDESLTTMPAGDGFTAE